ncbi:Hypothetical_protein [Hexamita inflata]|uniref:Hypothetical_protein n=1 Tax=Hexamita inflata TaxID=28002 RepID=A0AA86UYJ1_9EUKA|nr:Hypothetical protein HINF_LOCUS40533 [Hexamita inflata]
MPYVIVTNTFNLEIKWSDDLNAQPIDTEQLKIQYNYINIQGTNKQKFDCYDVFNRSLTLDIINSDIALSQIQGNMRTLSLIGCVCRNDFTDKCTIQRLNVLDTQVKSNQLLNLKMESLSVRVCSQDQFDYYNCLNLNCGYDSLSFVSQNVDLQQLRGAWNTIELKNCILCGQIDSNLFKVKVVELTVTDLNYLNNFEVLQCLECNSFHVKSNEYYNYQAINLGKLSNDKQQKKNIYAYLEQVICDLTYVTDIWTCIILTNCTILCEANTINTKLGNTIVEIAQNSEYKPLDISNLYQNKVSDLQAFQLCKPKCLSLSELNLDLDELKGNWDSLNFHECVFTNSVVQDPGSIKAKYIRILSNIDYKLISQFSADSLELGLTTISKAFPNTNRLIIQGSTVNVTEPNRTIQHLLLFGAKLIRFSVLTLHSLVSIDLNYISKSSSLYSTKEATIHYIRQKKKNRNILKQRLNRVTYEQKRIQSAQNRISSLVRSIDSFLCEPIQRSLLLFDE